MTKIFNDDQTLSQAEVDAMLAASIAGTTLKEDTKMTKREPITVDVIPYQADEVIEKVMQKLLKKIETTPNNWRSYDESLSRSETEVKKEHARREELSELCKTNSLDAAQMDELTDSLVRNYYDFRFHGLCYTGTPEGEHKQILDAPTAIEIECIRNFVDGRLTDKNAAYSTVPCDVPQTTVVADKVMHDLVKKIETAPNNWSSVIGAWRLMPPSYR